MHTYIITFNKAISVPRLRIKINIFLVKRSVKTHKSAAFFFFNDGWKLRTEEYITYDKRGSGVVKMKNDDKQTHGECTETKEDKRDTKYTLGLHRQYDMLYLQFIWPSGFWLFFSLNPPKQERNFKGKKCQISKGPSEDIPPSSGTTPYEIVILLGNTIPIISLSSTNHAYNTQLISST